MAIALHHSKAKGTAKLLLLGIANHDGDGGAWPSISTLKRYAGGIDRRAIQRALQTLEELGEIKRHIQAGGTLDMAKSLRPNYYEFLLKCPDWCDHSRNHRDVRKPLISFEEESDIDPAVTAPPGGHSTAGGAVTAPPKPSLELIKRLNKETYVVNRASESEHSYADSGWCITCVFPNEHRKEIEQVEQSA